MKRLHWVVGLSMSLLASLLMLSGCSSKKDNGVNKDGKTTFKVGLFKWAGYAPVHLAKEKGFFEGIDVKISMIEDTAARRTALLADEIDGAADILDSFVCAYASGMPAKVVLKFDDSNGGDGIVAKSSIKTIKDLKGKKVAFAKDQPSHFLLITLLEREGLSISDITASPVNEADIAADTYTAGEVDAAVTWEPSLSKAAKNPNSHILVTSKQTPGLIVDVFTVRNDFLDKNPEAVKAFIKGWYKALDYHKENQKDAEEIMAKWMKQEVPEFKENLAGIRYGDPQSNKDFFMKGEKGGSKFSQLVSQASKVWLAEKVIKRSVEAKSIDATDHVLSIK